MLKYSHHLLHADVISLFVASRCQNILKILKIVNIEEENILIFQKTCIISIKVSGKNVTCDNIINHKKARFHHLSRKIYFWKNQREVKLIPSPSFNSYLKNMGKFFFPWSKKILKLWNSLVILVQMKHFLFKYSVFQTQGLQNLELTL